MRRCYRCGKVGHIGKNCNETTDTGEYINVLTHSTMYSPIFDTGATMTIVPEREILTQIVELDIPITVTLTNGSVLRLKEKGVLTLTWDDGTNLRIEDAYVAADTTDIIVSAAKLLKQQNCKCVLTTNMAFISSKHEADGRKYTLTTCGNVAEG